MADGRKIWTGATGCIEERLKTIRRRKRAPKRKLDDFLSTCNVFELESEIIDIEGDNESRMNLALFLSINYFCSII